MTAIPSIGAFGYKPLGLPTCWQFFGFDGPTNEHNLRGAYYDRLSRAFSTLGIAVIERNFQECLAELKQ